MSEKRRGNFISLQTRITNSIKWQNIFKGEEKEMIKRNIDKKNSQLYTFYILPGKSASNIIFIVGSLLMWTII